MLLNVNPIKRYSQLSSILPIHPSGSNLESRGLLLVQIESIFIPLNRGLRIPGGHTVDHQLFLSLHQSHVVRAYFEPWSHCSIKRRNVNAIECHRMSAKSRPKQPATNRTQSHWSWHWWSPDRYRRRTCSFQRPTFPPSWSKAFHLFPWLCRSGTEWRRWRCCCASSESSVGSFHPLCTPVFRQHPVPGVCRKEAVEISDVLFNEREIRLSMSDGNTN